MKGEIRDEGCNLKTLICFALKEEAAPFRKMATSRPGLSVLITGIGRRNAETSVRDFLAAGSPELVLTCGFAGGLNPDLKPGEVVFEVANAPLSPPGGERVSARTGEGLVSKLSAAGAKSAKFFCADRIATTVAEKKKLRGETGADVVEMESAAVHAVCRERGISCATVRVISDTANGDLPLDFNVLSKPDQSLDYGKLFLAIAKSPGKLGALMRLQKQTRLAAERLAEVLARIL
jgi:adenosylhomocysteine nucleosidase